MVQRGIVRSSEHRATASIEFEPSLVRKRLRWEFGFIEADRAQQAAELGNVSGYFRAPFVKEYVEGRRELVLERLTHIRSCASYMSGVSDSGEAILFATGKALAYIHEHLRAPTGAELLRRVSGPCSEDDHVALHGDFHVGHVWWSEFAGCPVILDWGGGGSKHGPMIHGARYYDLGQFIVSLARLRPYVRSLGLLRSRVGALLQGYEDEWGQPMNDAALTHYVGRFARGRVRESRRKANGVSDWRRVARIGKNGIWYCAFKCAIIGLCVQGNRVRPEAQSC